MAPRHSNILMAIFTGVLGVTLIWIFYASPLRDRVENKLFDIRTRLSPNFVEPEHVAIVEIDDQAIAALEPSATPVADKVNDLSVRNLTAVVKAALRTNPQLVAVLLPPQVFPYNDPGLAELTTLAAQDPRIVLGTFDLTLKRRDPEGLPAAFRSVVPQLAKADIFRNFRREIVRDLRVAEHGELPYLSYAIAARIAPEATTALEAFRRGDFVTIKLNYFALGALRRIRADALMAAPEAANLKGRAVLIGYTSYRPFTVHAPEATLINSPWQADGSGLEEGIPILSLQAMAVENIVREMHLKSAPNAVNMVQTALLTVLTLAIWRLSVGFASFLFIGGWSITLLLHAGAFAFANLYIPLADAALSSSLAMMAGALWRLRIEGRLRVIQEAKASSQAEMARVQDRFLNRFAVELAEINKKIKAALAPHQELKEAGGTTAKAYVRALGSSEELDDYLQGIHQFAVLPGPGAKKPRLAIVDLKEVTEKVLRQFESRKREQRIQTEVVAEGSCLALADRMLVSQILYNLVSNAIKYSPPDRTVSINLGTDAHATRVAVKDQGPGIAVEYQDRIFEKFYRVKDDHVYKLKGHGLGLFLSRYFAEEIGATLVVVSEPGLGAEFVLTLKPVKRA